MTDFRPGYTIATFAAVLLVWSLASKAGWVTPFLLPSPWKVLATLGELARSGELLRNTLVSLRRVAAGYALAVLLSMLLSVLFSRYVWLRRMLEPPLEFLRQVPPLALMPLLLLWLGIGEAQKIGIIILSCFFPIFLGMRSGIAQVDPRLVEIGQVCGLTRNEILRRIVLPASLPAIVVGLRLGLGYGWRALVGAELIASSAGIGYMIVDAESLARTDIVLAGILVIGLIGLLTDTLLKVGVARAAPWLAGSLESARA